MKTEKYMEKKLRLLEAITYCMVLQTIGWAFFISWLYIVNS